MNNQTTLSAVALAKAEIIRIPLDKLLPHPENPNKMSKQTFEKLKRHIKQSHNYEPLIVRKHPETENHFQIINGHHRADALKQIGETFADCVIWNIDDDQARILLATLNRLGGKDELSVKAELIKSLSEKFSVKELTKLLPDSKQAIERLKDITKSLPQFEDDAKAFLNTLVFFLNDEQIKIVNSALDATIKTQQSRDSIRAGKSEKLANAITIIAKDYLNHSRR
ncbi:MAG: ParB/RepB/Spo0J family partition protein [Phycisphaerae bacterium]|nr:ParB/RepB/Spo0J family partition protein [Phycisphaerae bacterium]